MVFSGLNMKMFYKNSLVVLFLIETLIITTSCSDLHMEQSAPPSRIQHCREGCLEKFETESFACLQGPECSISGFPIYNFNILPDAFHLLCWDQCASVAASSSISSKINTSILDAWPLSTMSMVLQGSLVSADVRWPSLNAPSQCLVTWEVFGGGLMGNLLTDSSSVQLSLWPKTKYRVQVTCKNKNTEVMTRSLPLTLDTSSAVELDSSTTVAESTDGFTVVQDKSSTTTRLPAVPITNDEDILSNSIDTDDNEPENHKNNYYKQQHQQQQQRHHPTVDTLGIWKIYDSRKEVVLGICAAILVFFIIVTLFVMSMKRTRPIIDKERLIDNEVCADFDSHTVHV